MQVIPLMDVEEMPSDLRTMVERWAQVEDGDPNFLRTLGNAPEMLRRFVPFYSPIVRRGVLEHRTKEIVRINIAFHNQCKYCMATRYGSGRRAGIDEALVAQISDYEHGPFSERERAALALSDALVFDPPEIEKRLLERLRAAFSDDEILELVWAVCLWIETGRLFAALGVPYGADAPSGIPALASP